MTEGGYEYNLVLLATIFALTEAGPGAVSLDRVFGTERCGTAWAVGQLTSGTAGSMLMSKLGESAASGQMSATEAGQSAGSPG